jgi:hypothetical protein
MRVQVYKKLREPLFQINLSKPDNCIAGELSIHCDPESAGQALRRLIGNLAEGRHDTARKELGKRPPDLGRLVEPRDKVFLP